MINITSTTTTITSPTTTNYYNNKYITNIKMVIGVAVNFAVGVLLFYSCCCSYCCFIVPAVTHWWAGCLGTGVGLVFGSWKFKN